MTVSIPGKAIDVSSTGHDLSAPTQQLLLDLRLLSTDNDLKDANSPLAAFSGTPDSVVVIEAGVTRAAKWWTLAVAALGAGWTTAVVKLWTGFAKSNYWNQPVTIFAVGLTFAAAVVSIAYVLGSDIRGRASATVATVEARRQVAVAMIHAAQNSFQQDVASAAATPITLPGIIPVNNGEMIGIAEQGWNAMAVREKDGNTEFLLTKGPQTSWVESKHVEFL